MKNFIVTSFCSEPDSTPTWMLTSLSLSLTVKCEEMNPISASDIKDIKPVIISEKLMGSYGIFEFHLTIIIVNLNDGSIWLQ